MGFWGSVIGGVTKVADFATGGKVGEMIADALEKFGLPKDICNIFAMIGDPSYSTKAICEEIDRVGKALGLPEELTGALKKIAQKAEQYTQAFFQGGFGGVVCAIGKDLGLPPAIYEGIAAAIDAYTGNEAGAAAHLANFAVECAKLLGIPTGAVGSGLKVAVDLASGNSKKAVADGLDLAADVVDSMDLPAEYKDLVHLGADTYASALGEGDTKAIVADAVKLGGHVAERVGLPPEFSTGLKLSVAYLMDDKEGMKAAGQELAGDLVQRLDVSPGTKALLTLASRKAIEHADEVDELLDKVPRSIEGAEAYVRQQAESVMAFTRGVAADALGLEVDWKTLAGNLLESVKAGTVEILEDIRKEAINTAKARKDAFAASLERTLHPQPESPADGDSLLAPQFALEHQLIQPLRP